MDKGIQSDLKDVYLECLRLKTSLRRWYLNRKASYEKAIRGLREEFQKEWTDMQGPWNMFQEPKKKLWIELEAEDSRVRVVAGGREGSNGRWWDLEDRRSLVGSDLDFVCFNEKPWENF